ncbi:Adaptive-response sensory-kinase SasA [Caprobacter fermentans]|uniref:histidine kinase n=1 Tax=Caproicibacter fermentans TaxID=2576756 RepID=A0A6N8I463_9FIRM|nr:HAMP domain-containing sensor histidine kinase [Caproicibacter fermentans]MVB12293.1 Adaptive-response sensory-kinase SasA [Caproicibacter fermentans]OCN02661.1 two-component sensor histidine kinase [Clostridium sp. W14A]
MGLRNRNIRLRTFFIRYLLTIFAGFVLIVLIGIGLLFLSLKTGFVLSVGDVEASIERQKAAIASAETVSAELIPKTCKYAVVGTNGEFLSGNMTASEAAEAWDVVRSGRTISGSLLSTGLNANCYFPIQRRNGYCIIGYSSMSQFSSRLLREHLTVPEILLLWMILAASLFEIVFLSRLYGRKISRKLIPLQNATEKIRKKDLAFEIESSGIEEIDAALQSLDSMKTELGLSLEKQWKMEQTKRTQISALAHDLKTPLTVVRGNAEMLDDTNQTAEQKEYTRYIMKNADQMERYVQMLIDISKAEAGFSLRRKDTPIRAFLDELYAQIGALASVKQIKTQFDEKNLPDTICVDVSFLQRAVINIVSNAVDYSPEHGTIWFSVSAENHKIRFTVTDSGKGFSPEDLKSATSQFYQGDFSRNSKLHYGMGLFIAASIVKLHGGTLTIANSPATGGGMVAIEI